MHQAPAQEACRFDHKHKSLKDVTNVKQYGDLWRLSGDWKDW